MKIVLCMLMLVSSVAGFESSSCARAVPLQECCKMVRSCQKDRDADRMMCLESELILDEENEYYSAHGWSLYKDWSSQKWTLEQCDSHIIAVSNVTSPCPSTLPSHVEWSFKGYWGDSKPGSNVIFEFQCV